MLIPLWCKDLWNQTPVNGDSQFLQYYQTPELQKLLPVLYPSVFPNLAAVNMPRADLVAILLTGIPTGVVPGFQNFTGATQADMLRLNVAVPPSAQPNPVGLVAGDAAGFPNGRRLIDDVVSIELRAIAGVTLPLVAPSFKPDDAAGQLKDGTTPSPTSPFLSSFPYVGTPNEGLRAPVRRRVTFARVAQLESAAWIGCVHPRGSRARACLRELNPDALRAACIRAMPVGKVAPMVYPLPRSTQHSVLDVAGRSQLLLFGELHGTCEVPSVIAALLPRARLLGYRGLALEIPFDARDHLAGRASGRATQPPAFYSHPSKDGRGNQQALDLAATAAASGFELLCFDQGQSQIAHDWAARDQWMATNLLEQWRRFCVGERVVAICGSLHARLSPDQGVGRWLRKAASGGQTLWPWLALAARARADARGGDHRRAVRGGCLLQYGPANHLRSAGLAGRSVDRTGPAGLHVRVVAAAGHARDVQRDADLMRTHRPDSSTQPVTATPTSTQRNAAAQGITRFDTGPARAAHLRSRLAAAGRARGAGPERAARAARHGLRRAGRPSGDQRPVHDRGLPASPTPRSGPRPSWCSARTRRSGAMIAAVVLPLAAGSRRAPSPTPACSR